MLYTYTPLPSYGIPSLAGLIPALNPGLPEPLAVAMGIPENASATHMYCDGQADCIYGGGLRQVCFRHSCECTFSAKYEYPFCVDPTSRTMWAKVMYSLFIAIYSVTTLALLAVAVKRFRTTPLSRKTCANFFTTSLVFGILGCMILVVKYVVNLDEVLHAEKYEKYYNVQRSDGILQVVAAMFLMLSPTETL